jgi:Integrase core domain
MPNVVDVSTLECSAIRVEPMLKKIDLIEVLANLLIMPDAPEHTGSDKWPEFIAVAVRKWIVAMRIKAAYIAPVSRWKNGFVESLPARLRNEHLTGEVFNPSAEARVITGQRSTWTTRWGRSESVMRRLTRDQYAKAISAFSTTTPTFHFSRDPGDSRAQTGRNRGACERQ